MKTTKTLGLLSVGLFLMIFLIGVINAQTLIAGKIYASGYANIVSGAGVTVTCNSYPLTTNLNPLTTNSLDDGTYAVRFGENICNNTGNSVEVNSGKGSLSGSGTGIVVECDDTDDCDSGLFSIVNLAIKSQSSNNNGGGSHNSGGYYFCGNRVCDTGENVDTCPRDCAVAQNQTTATTNTETTDTQLLNNETKLPETQIQTSFSKITGAVIGALGGTGWLIIIVFILGIIGLSLSIRIIRKRNSVNETIQ